MSCRAAQLYRYLCRSDISWHRAVFVLDVILKFFAEILDECTYRHCRRITQRTDRAALDVIGNRVQHIEVFQLAVTVFDTFDHAVHPASAFAAWRTLTAGLFVVEVSQTQQRLDHAARFIHHDDRARTQHRAGLGDGIVIHGGFHHDVAANHRSGRAARNDRLDLRAAAHTAGQFQQCGEWRAQRNFVIAWTFDVARDREDLGAAVVRLADVGVRLCTDLEDERNSSECFGVVDRGWLTVQAETGWERRFEARLALLAFERLQQCGFFAADVGAITMMTVQLEAEVGAEDVVAKETCCTRFFQRFFKTQIRVEDFAVDVVVADRDAHRITADDHAFDQRVRVITNDVAVFECARFAFIAVANEVFLTWELTRHEAPLQAGREASTAAATQAGSLQFSDDLFRSDVFSEDALERFIAATLDVIRQVPVLAVQIRKNQRFDMTIVQTSHFFSSSSSASILSFDIQLHMRWLLTSMTGASPHAPMHSPSTIVN